MQFAGLFYIISNIRSYWKSRNIKDDHKSDVVGPHLIESPVLGPISPKELSGGVKTLILMAFDDAGKAKIINTGRIVDDMAGFSEETWDFGCD